MKGVILAGGSGSRLRPLTQVTSKQLLPVFDKPMVYYPLSTLMHAGVNEVLVISTPEDTPRLKELLGNGNQFGINISFTVQEKPEGLAQGVKISSDFTNGEKFWFILGDNFFHGPTFGSNLRILNESFETGCLIFAYHVQNASAYGVVVFDEKTEKVLGLVEKPKQTNPGWAIPGLYLFDARATEYVEGLQPSKRGEYEILDLLDRYRAVESLRVEKVSRGNAWFDLGSVESLQIGSQFVQAIQTRQGQLIGSPEEAGLRAGYLNPEEFVKTLEKMPSSGYYDLLRAYF